MAKEKALRVQGVVQQVLPNTKFKVEICDDEGKTLGHEIVATISGKIRINYVKIAKGDKVGVELSPYYLKTGRIVWRY